MKKLLLVWVMGLVAISSLIAQRTITGTLTDSAGETLIGASVLEKNTSNGTVSDVDGTYSITVAKDATTLVYSYTGFATQEVVIGTSNQIDVTLATDDVLLEEIVVVGYNSLKKSDLTSSVSTVSGRDLVAQPIGSIDNLLQGKSTGVQVLSQNGRPGGNAYIRVRGVGSVNASNDPLFILDGVQITASDYNTINPNDIENISILKDAAATSIYGSRASNGVVVVTSKSGNANSKPKISYNFQYGTKSVSDLGFEMMDARTKLNYEVEVGSRSQESADAMIAQLDAGTLPETNWEDELLREGNLKSHDFSISGGNQDASYFFSLSAYDEQGVSLGSDFSRLTGRLNFDYKVTDWLKVGNTLTLSKTEEDELRDRFNVQNPFYGVYGYNRYEPVFSLDENGDAILDEDGNPTYNLAHFGFSIVEAIKNTPENADRTNAIGSIFAEATILPQLTFKTQLGGNYRIYRRDYYITPGSVLDGYVGDPLAPGIKTDNGSDRSIVTWSNTLNYGLSLSDVHNLNFLAGTEYNKRNLNSYTLSGKGFPSATFSTQDNAAEITDGGTSRSEWALWSQFGAVRYNFNERYYATASLRRDGSSRFGVDNKNGLFWAGSVAWNLAKEDFMPQSGIFDQLKVRASIGTSGNEPSDFYWQGVYGFGSYNDQTASFPSDLSNNAIKWEEALSFSTGLDFGLFNNRISGSFDYYIRNTSDLLFNQALSQTTGWTSRLANIGEMKNSGIELELIGSVLRSKNINVSLFGSFSTNKNEIVNLSNESQDIINASSGVSLLREGLPVNTYYLVRYAGVDPATGDALYYDIDGNITNEYSSDDAVALEGKAPQPKYFGGFGLTADVYGIDVGANFYYSGGNYIYNYMKAVNESDGNNIGDNQSVTALDHWKNPGDVNVLPRPQVTNNINDSDRYLQRGDYIRLRNLTVGYTIPQDLTRKIKVQQLRLFIQGTNLWTFNPYFQGDPEVGRGSDESDLTLAGEFTLFTYPQTKGFTFGANVTF